MRKYYLAFYSSLIFLTSFGQGVLAEPILAELRQEFHFEDPVERHIRIYQNGTVYLFENGVRMDWIATLAPAALSTFQVASLSVPNEAIQLLDGSELCSDGNNIHFSLASPTGSLIEYEAWLDCQNWMIPGFHSTHTTWALYGLLMMTGKGL